MSEHIQNCHIDYLSFTIRASDLDLEEQKNFVVWLVRRIFGTIALEDTGKGWRGYTKCYTFAAGAIAAFGGDINNHTIHFSLPGETCQLVADWNSLADYLDDSDCKITRCDIAHDDYEGETLSIEWARNQYNTSGFKPARGISPKSRLVSDEGNGDGSTYYVGSRNSGKLCRVYEKGKQLGDKFSKWMRFEVEWLSTHRELCSNMLRDPSSYLAGSYPCAKFIQSRIQTVQTIAYKAAAVLEKAKDHAHKQAGSFIAAMRQLGHSFDEICRMIARPEPTKRLSANVEALKVYRDTPRPDHVPAWYRPPTEDDKRRINALLTADLSWWRMQWAQFQT